MRIFVTGSIAYDYIMVFPGRFRDHILPDKMHVLSVSFLVDSLTRLRGGTGANISFNLGLLGEHPFLVGTVGDDFADYRAMAGKPWRGLPNGQGYRGRPHSIVFHQYRPAGQPDHGVLSRRDGARRVALARGGRSDPDDLVVIAPNDPAAMNRYAAECIAAETPYLYDPSMQLPRLEREELEKGCRGARIMAGNDYEFGMMAEKLAVSRSRTPPHGADHRHDQGRGRCFDHCRHG